MPNLELSLRQVDTLRNMIADYEHRLAPAPPPLAPDKLSEREHEVLVLLAYGRSYLEISAHCYIGISTVKTHVASILSKMGARNARHAVLLACQASILTPQDTEPAN